jgi:cell division protease FtsH
MAKKKQEFKIDWNNVRLHFRLFWVRWLIIGIAAVTVVSIVVLFIMGMNAFMASEDFYKKNMMAQLPMSMFLYLIVGALSAVINTVIWMYFMFGGGMQKMNVKRVKAEHVSVKLSDVVGMDAIKREAFEVINLLKDRTELQKVGGKIIKGLILMGPPGCGKTYLAKAIATETGLPFLPAAGSEFIQMFVGVGAMRVRQLFKEARVYAKTHGGCLIFIDEVDAIARARSADTGMGGNSEHNSTVNQFLTELDGMREQENIVVIAATNVSERELDPALMRPGRFDRKLYVSLPGLKDREDLFGYYLKKVKFDPAVSCSVLARRCVGFSPASISNMIREASLISIREKRDMLTYKDLSEAYDRVQFGLKDNRIVQESDKEWTAYHEAGHAIIAYLTHPTDDVIKATIIPRKGFLGYVHHTSMQELETHTKEYFLANIMCALGGYAAEKLKFNSTSSGVSQDFSMAMSMAYDMVWKWGMGPSGFIGNFALFTERGGYYGSDSRFSESTKEKLDADVQLLLTNCIKEVEELLKKESALLDHFAQKLIEKQELDYDEIEAIFKLYGKSRPAGAARADMPVFGVQSEEV